MLVHQQPRMTTLVTRPSVTFRQLYPQPPTKLSGINRLRRINRMQRVSAAVWGAATRGDTRRNSKAMLSKSGSAGRPWPLSHEVPEQAHYKTVPFRGAESEGSEEMITGDRVRVLTHLGAAAVGGNGSTQGSGVLRAAG